MRITFFWFRPFAKTNNYQVELISSSFVVSEIHLCSSNTTNNIVGEIIGLLERDSVSREAIKQLENELNVYKRAYAGLDAERQRFEQQIQEVEKKKEDLENQLKVRAASIIPFTALTPSQRVTGSLLLLMVMVLYFQVSSLPRDNLAVIQPRRSCPTPFLSISHRPSDQTNIN